MNALPPAVCASAPGKAILFGEHSVVYGQPAVAAALSDLRIQVLMTPNSSNVSPMIRMIMPDLPDPVDCQVPSAALLALNYQLQAPPTPECTQHLEDLIRKLARNNSDSSRIADEHTIHAILPVLYLISQLAPTFIFQRGCTVQVRSLDLPVGAGLGSSAAFGVACAAALFQWKLFQSTAPAVVVQAPTSPSEELVKEINRYAYYSEILLHGRPSGIDNTVSSHGGALLFTRSHHEVSLESIAFSQPLKLLLVYTKVPRQTKKLVAAVRTLYDQHPTIITPVLEAMGKIATTFCGTVTDKRMSASQTAETIRTLVRTNQSLLAALGVSHPSLDRICSTVNAACPEEAAAKLTGAGGGGCAMVLLLSPEADEASLKQRLISALQKAAHPDYHFTYLSSTVGGDGVLFVPPADFFEGNVLKGCKQNCGPISTMIRVAAAAAVATSALVLLRSRRL